MKEINDQVKRTGASLQTGWMRENLKQDWAIMTIQQQHQELLKAIKEQQPEDLHGLLPWILEQVFGSLDGSNIGWDLLHCHKGDSIRTFLQPSGPLMKYTLRLTGYSYEVRLSTLPIHVRQSISRAAPALCPVFQDKLQTHGQALFFNSFEIHMLYLASTLLTLKSPSGQQCWVTESLYFCLLKDFLTHFLPLEGHMRKYPGTDARKQSLNNQLTGECSVKSSNLLRRQVTNSKAGQACQGNWASWTVLQVFVEIWITDFSTHRQHPGDITQTPEVLLPSEAHMMAVKQLLKHLHAFSRQGQANHQISEVRDVSGQVLHIIQSKVFSLLQHCFTHWPCDSSFRAALEAWLSYIQPWKYTEHRKQSCRSPGEGVGEHWSQFVQENLQMYTVLFRMFLQRTSHADLTESSLALMLCRVAKVFAKPGLSHLIHTGEQQHQHSLHCQAKVNPKDLQLRDRKSLCQCAVLQNSVCTSMFDSETQSQVMQLLQVIVQAQCSVNQTTCVTRPTMRWFCPVWFSLPSRRAPEREGDEEHMSSLKMAEQLDRAKLHLCQVFKLGANMASSTGATEEDVDKEELPDCVEGENGLVLTDLGRMQIINEVRKFKVGYQGDPDLQPVRSYESTLLVKLMAWITSHISTQFGRQMADLCSRQDQVGSVCRHLFLSPCDKSGRIRKSPMLMRACRVQRQREQKPRLSLRVLASYRTLLFLALVYVLGCVLCSSPLLLCGLAVVLLALLNPLSPTLSHWSRKYKYVIHMTPRLGE